MKKYQEALEELSNFAIYDDNYEVSVKKDFLPVLENDKKLLQELVDRDKENFGYILRTKDSRFHTRIAFHTEKEALEFVQKHEVKGCSLDGVKFFKESDYGNE